MNRHRKYILLLLTVLLWAPASSQIARRHTFMDISLKDIIEMGRTRNLSFRLAETRLSAAEADLADAELTKLPTLFASAAYQRYSKLTLFEDGLAGTKSISRLPGPNGASLGLDVAFNLYSGGKIRAAIQQQTYKKNTAAINREESGASGALEAGRLYLSLLEQYNLKKLIAEQIERANSRLKNVNALYHNERVTRSDVLRTELMLSDVHLLERENLNNISIINNKLTVLLNLDTSIIVRPLDSAGMARPNAEQISALIKSGTQQSYGIRLADTDIGASIATAKIINSSALPTISLVSAYNFSYPNNLFFPPVDQLYSIGYIGVRMSYNISSLYHNKFKEKAANIRIIEARQQKQILSDQIGIALRAMEIRYQEALNRINVLNSSIDQAKVNLRIINTKYKNQLALLTDLLDADNILQEAAFKLVRAQTETITLYYNLLYALGKI